MQVAFPSVEFFRCNVGSYGYGQLPELVRRNYSMAARGSEMVPEEFPHSRQTVNEYLERLSTVGLDRRSRSRLPNFVGATA